MAELMDIIPLLANLFEFLKMSFKHFAFVLIRKLVEVDPRVLIT